MPDQPMLISQSMVTRSLSDPGFLQRVPELAPLKAKFQANKVSYAKPGGCGGCKQRKVQQNVYGEYVAAVQALSPEALERIKQYFGTQRFMVNNVEAKTNKITLRIF